MRRAIQAWLADVLNAGLDPRTADAGVLRRVRIFTHATLGLILLGVPALPLNLWLLGPGMAATLLGAMALCSANLLWLRRHRDPARAGHVGTAIFFTFLVVLIAHTGGWHSPAAALLYLVPIASALIVNARAAWAWSGSALLVYCGFLWADRTGGALPNRIDPGAWDLYQLVSHGMAVTAVAVLAASFVRAQRRMEATLRKSHAHAQREAAYVRLLHQAAIVANDATSIDEAFYKSVRLVCRETGWRVGNVWRPDGAGGLRAAPVGYQEDDPRLETFQESRRGSRRAGPDSLAGRVLAQRAPLWWEDMCEEPAFPRRDAARAAGLHAALAFPVVMGNEVIAVFEFMAGEPRRPDRRMLRLLSHIGTQVARVTERKRAEAEIENLAYYDGLTGLPNRQLFQARLESALGAARRAGNLAALLFVDLDGFKRVNDTLGHSVGDALLREVTRRFTGSLRTTDLIVRPVGGPDDDDGHPAVSRLGGDEFTVLLGDVADRAGAAVVAERLLASLREPVSVENHEIFTGASIGIAVFPEDGEDPETLLRNADAAMYAAKGRGRGQFQFYADAGTEAGSRRLRLEGPLRRALERDQFELHFQPIQDMLTGETVAAEALLRWHEPELGTVSPAEFIPLAEQCGLINALGEWIVHAACAQLRTWIDAGHQPVRVAVNVSAQQIRGPELVETVADALRRNDLGPELLDLEITESTIMRDDEVTSSTLRALSEMGVGLVLDDFGTGYSSLSHLRRYPIDSLKIDRSFVSELPDSTDDAAITTALIAMAHGLRARVAAEGIETEAQLEFLRAAGCDLLQGFLFGRPVPGTDFERFLRREKDADA